MRKKLYWGITTLVVLLLGVNAFLLLRNTDTEPTKPKVIYKDVTPEQLDNIRKHVHSQIKSTQKPPDEPGFKWVWHHNHWDKVAIPQTPDTLIADKEVQKSKPVQVNSVVPGVGDLKEYLTFFESFSDDPTLNELRDANFNKKSIQFGESMRGFDYENASPKLMELVRQISEKITELGYIYSEKASIEDAEYEANRLATTDPQLIYGPIGIIPKNPDENENTEGGKE